MDSSGNKWGLFYFYPEGWTVSRRTSDFVSPPFTIKLAASVGREKDIEKDGVLEGGRGLQLGYKLHGAATGIG